ncbi:peptidyl-tRNA hydrolase [Capsulimonas corticalis]|uniref:Peptidyl-tRNA hydrolase n=1 Tax=Capsulimonas corticalis TaxID=2219043 RepID=A0A402CVU2_9BACT|nr:aminoacyl-tRNA hydrolase [Capsulimonas corticalis]BDI30526.1 peptidyl-tRNA hydrolase [Capsulimonas corticalis]
MDIPTKLIIGLGNPGKEYDGTRHNIGFDVIDHLARINHITVAKRDYRALVGDGRIADTRVFLLKPQTFMNLSGESAAQFLRQRPLALTEILVITDDIALPVGKLRLRAGGSAGGHNGLKSLIAHLHSQEFPRLRFGVGAPRDASVQIDFVLGKFSKAEQRDVEETVDRAAAAAEAWIRDGIEPAMNKFNQ